MQSEKRQVMPLNNLKLILQPAPLGFIVYNTPLVIT